MLQYKSLDAFSIFHFLLSMMAGKARPHLPARHCHRAVSFVLDPSSYHFTWHGDGGLCGTLETNHLSQGSSHPSEMMVIWNPMIMCGVFLLLLSFGTGHSVPHCAVWNAAHRSVYKYVCTAVYLCTKTFCKRPHTLQLSGFWTRERFHKAKCDARWKNVGVLICAWQTLDTRPCKGRRM